MTEKCDGQVTNDVECSKSSYRVFEKVKIESILTVYENVMLEHWENGIFECKGIMGDGQLPLR